MFKALVVEKEEDGTRASVQELPDDRLPEGEVTVGVEWSTLNYKDGLCIGPGGGLVRSATLTCRGSTSRAPWRSPPTTATGPGTA